MTDIYRCPECHNEVFAKSLAAFRCPVCGYAGGNQLNLFRHGKPNDGTIQKLRDFDPDEVRRNAYIHREKQRFP